MAFKQRHRCELRNLEQTGSQTVIDVVVVVGDLIGQVGDLCLEAGLPLQQESLTQLSKLSGIFGRTVFEDPFARLERQIESVERGIPLLEFVDDAQ